MTLSALQSHCNHSVGNMRHSLQGLYNSVIFPLSSFVRTIFALCEEPEIAHTESQGQPKIGVENRPTCTLPVLASALLVTMEVLDNGATVCSEHGLEVCGACGVDYRLLNSERGVSAPQPEPLSIKAKKLGASEDGLKDLDPSLLPAIVDTAPRAAWGGRGPLKQGFDRAFSMAEKQNSHLGIRPTVDADLTFHVRETLLAIAHCLEVEKCRTKMIQDKAQSLGICIVCLGAYEAGAADKQDHQDNEEGLPEKPIILLWYQCNSVTDPLFPEKMRSMSAGLAEGKRVGSAIQDEKQGMSTCETDRKEVEAIKILLDHNSKLLSKEWLAKNKPPPTFTASFVTPLKKKTMSHQPSEAVRTCVCGASNPKLRCSRCASVWYCSKACQVADWKAGHKRACRLPQDRAADEHTVIARVGRPDEVLEQAGARYLCTFSHHASSGDVQKQLKHPKDKVQRFDMFEPLSVPVGEGNVFIRLGLLQRDQLRSNLTWSYLIRPPATSLARQCLPCHSPRRLNSLLVSSLSLARAGGARRWGRGGRALTV